jgi:hypothetical protein
VKIWWYVFLVYWLLLVKYYRLWIQNILYPSVIFFDFNSHRPLEKQIICLLFLSCIYFINLKKNQHNKNFNVHWTIKGWKDCHITCRRNKRLIKIEHLVLSVIFNFNDICPCIYAFVCENFIAIYIKSVNVFLFLIFLNSYVGNDFWTSISK